MAKPVRSQAQPEVAAAGGRGGGSAARLRAASSFSSVSGRRRRRDRASRAVESASLRMPSGPNSRRRPAVDHRLGGLPDVVPGIERAGDAFDLHHGLLQQHQFGPQMHAEHDG